MCYACICYFYSTKAFPPLPSFTSLSVPSLSLCPAHGYLTFSTSDPFSLPTFYSPSAFPLIFKHFQYCIFKIHFIQFFLSIKRLSQFLVLIPLLHTFPFNCRHLMLIISLLLPFSASSSCALQASLRSSAWRSRSCGTRGVLTWVTAPPRGSTRWPRRWDLEPYPPVMGPSLSSAPLPRPSSLSTSTYTLTYLQGWPDLNFHSFPLALHYKASVLRT